MITVEFLVNDSGVCLGFRAQGHSQAPQWIRYLPWRTDGRDIVCSAVSALAGAAVLGLLEMAPDCGTLEDEQDELAYRLQKRTAEAEVILNVFKLGIIDIKRQYPRLIDVQIREESNGS